MKKKPVELYLIGGTTGFLGGILMLVASYLIVFRVELPGVGLPAQQLAYIAEHPLVGVTHGVSVAALMLIVPTVVALFVLLNTVVVARGYLGVGFATVWIIVEMVGHLAQTAPFRALSDLYNNLLHRDAAVALYHFVEEFAEAMTLTSATLACLAAICYGLALIEGWNRVSGYLFFLAVLAFPIGLFIPDIGVQLHVALRGLAFLVVGGVLINIALTED